MRFIPVWEKDTPTWIKVAATVQVVCVLWPMIVIAFMCFLGIALWPAMALGFLIERGLR